MKIDYLIVGQGLAGSLLAWTLHQRAQQIMIIDNGQTNASQVAAGLINPITGMRLVKTHDVETLLPSALHFYQQLEQHFGQTFYIEKPLLRILGNDKERQNALKRQQQPDYQPYLGDIIPANHTLNAPLGILKQQHTGYLLTRPLLDSLKHYFIQHNCYQQATFNHQDIQLNPLLRWQHLKPRHIIFCEGHSGQNNPWFNWLPFQPVKGEIITATSYTSVPQYILNYGHWLIPLNTHQFRSGATFDRENLDYLITEHARFALLNSLHQTCRSLNIEIIQQQAGIRPTTQDKHPFVGRHPDHPALIFFNGFGAKGSLQIPWFSHCLAEHLLNNQPIPPASHILRYNSLYSRS